ncbi:PstS family phosphate ABC transporter substrate-binding protein [uncultured Flavobacterium sp.]|uniref:PstS family phosphate ABC transporter substrate-binding protein n=1 Tax=uncultured Flavobacterium sp. TaxID=165435 RepID=UPI0025F29EE4|nr:substrate-binding domain-containing protein [uncultured Flavobacterium sp.]
MPKYLKIIFLSFVLIFAVVFVNSCKDKKEAETLALKETKATFLVDETLLPFMQDEVAVFESQKEVKITLVPKAETQILSDIQSGESGLLVMSRVLTEGEQRAFTNKKIVPKITQVAIDGIALIVNKRATYSIVDLQNVIDFMQGKPVPSIKGLVFDNPNSSTINYLKSVASVKDIDNKNVFALKTNDEVIKYISEKDGYIGVVGVNWITQPMPDMKQFTDAVKILAVKNVKSAPDSSKYYKPSQTNLAEGSYPLVRKIYMLNYEGARGLGTGFASFVAGDIGQKIVTSAGLAPVRLELREVKVRKEINTKN